MTTTENSRADALTDERIEQIARNHELDMPDGQDSIPALKAAIYEALDAALPVEQHAAAPASDERAVIEPLTEPVTISKALRAGRVARMEGTASAATAFLVNIQIAPWGQSKEWVQGYVDGFNRAAKWMQDALNSTPAYAGAAIRNSALEEAAHAVADHQRDGREWIRDSLWDTLTAEAAARIRALQSTSPAIPDVPCSSTPEWIRVRDRLPANDTWVLAHNGKWTGVAMYVSAAEFVDESWQDERREFIELLGPAVTHWMPMPPAPNDAASAGGSR
ncbi:DUF551 domain-containing protein [Burkholderia cepacia]|uniref:DUF551 domain-containing protein n=1 Tax=Burkholderia cepacia TaxID=292 RepID=UPI001CF19CF1|nr:DUF551 domain-containing protein [Burkholderia cepacia]MCA8351652.1 DUF551 domain-containing protein [Burkholderia cepacia]